MSKTWTMHVLGCGTAAYWLVMMLVDLIRSSLPSGTGDLDRLRRITFTDVARVRQHNRITCPGYRRSLWGQLKCIALAGLIRARLPASVILESYPIAVEELDWARLLPAQDLRRGEDTVIAILLDNWDSRLVALQDVRQRVAEVCPEAAEHVLMVTVGLDKGAAQVCTFTADRRDHCPLCWLPSLPMPEPCAVFDAQKRLLRGNLHRESQAAAKLVLQMIGDHRRRSERPSPWPNTNSHVLLPSAEAPGGSVETRPGRRMPGCAGPHSASVPVRWDHVLPSLDAFRRGHDGRLSLRESSVLSGSKGR